MKRIIVHWTAGTYKANETDRQHYHYIIEDDGHIVTGKFPVKANEVCQTDSAGKALYSAHTECGNTGSIGVSLAGMAGFKNRLNVGKYPLTKVQCERAFKLIAELCREYNIKITPETVLTHYEFDCNRGKAGRKIDIIYLPPYEYVFQSDVGNFIREKAKWYLSHI